MLQVRRLSVRYGRYTVLNDVSFSLGRGGWLMIVGPNGAGKSTLINAVAQAVPYEGSILLEGREVKTIPSRALARDVGVLSQNHYVGYAFTVEEVVRLGRYAYAPGIFSGGDKDGEALVDSALALTGMTAQRKQSVLTLSGGELQRCFLAQLFAQDPRIMLLDEPANHLDLVYQKQIFTLIREWMERRSRTVISVVHDLSLARMFGTGGILMDKGGIAARGSMEEICSPSVLNRVYSMDVAAWMRGLYAQWPREDAAPQEENGVCSHARGAQEP